MEKKKQILERINEIKKQIKTNSKDAHFAETLCDELVQKVKEWKHEPLQTADLGKEIDRIEGNTFYIAKHENGVLFHGRNLYDFVLPYSNYTQNMSGLANWLIENKQSIDNDEKDMQEFYKNTLQDFEYSFRMLLDMWLGYASTEKLKFDILGKYYTYLNEWVKQAMEQPLQEETPELNAEFKEATLAMEDVKETLDEAVKEIKANE